MRLVSFYCLMLLVIPAGAFSQRIDLSGNKIQVLPAGQGSLMQLRDTSLVYDLTATDFSIPSDTVFQTYFYDSLKNLKTVCEIERHRLYGLLIYYQDSLISSISVIDLKEQLFFSNVYSPEDNKIDRYEKRENSGMVRVAKDGFLRNGKGFYERFQKYKKLKYIN